MEDRQKKQKRFEANSEIKDGGSIQILGVRVSSSSIGSVLSLILAECRKKDLTRPYFVVTANPEIIMAAQADEEYRQVLNGADLVIADGAGLKLVGIRQIVPGRKLVRRLLETRLKVFYLGGKSGVAGEMANKFGGRWDEGHKNIKVDLIDPVTNERIINKINKYEPDLLLVAYGAPWQERWIAANLDKIKAKVVMGVGGTFDYLAGRRPEPPEWINRVGLEWAWRLVHEPWRWKRQLALIRFVGKNLFD